MNLQTDAVFSVLLRRSADLSEIGEIIRVVRRRTGDDALLERLIDEVLAIADEVKVEADRLPT